MRKPVPPEPVMEPPEAPKAPKQFFAITPDKFLTVYKLQATRVRMRDAWQLHGHNALVGSR